MNPAIIKSVGEAPALGLIHSKSQVGGQGWEGGDMNTLNTVEHQLLAELEGGAGLTLACSGGCGGGLLL